MRRREFISALGSAVAWPMCAGAQESGPIRRVGVMMGLPEDDPEAQVLATALREGSGRPGGSRGITFALITGGRSTAPNVRRKQ